jgi:hypothetical protein
MNEWAERKRWSFAVRAGHVTRNPEPVAAPTKQVVQGIVCDLCLRVCTTLVICVFIAPGINIALIRKSNPSRGGGESCCCSHLAGLVENELIRDGFAPYLCAYVCLRVCGSMRCMYMWSAQMLRSTIYSPRERAGTGTHTHTHTHTHMHMRRWSNLVSIDAIRECWSMGYEHGAVRSRHGVCLPTCRPSESEGGAGEVLERAREGEREREGER